MKEGREAEKEMTIEKLSANTETKRLKSKCL